MVNFEGIENLLKNLSDKSVQDSMYMTEQVMEKADNDLLDAIRRWEDSYNMLVRTAVSATNAKLKNETDLSIIKNVVSRMARVKAKLNHQSAFTNYTKSMC